MRRIGIVIAAAALLAGCTSIGGVRDGPAGVAIAALEAPAIVAVETRFKGELETALGQLEAKQPSKAEARQLSDAAAEAMGQLAIARLVYDATLRPSAPRATSAMVDAVREGTNDAYDRLQRRLGIYIAPPG